MDDPQDPKNPNAKQHESQEQKRSRIKNYWETSKSVGRTFLEKLPADKVLDSVDLGKEVYEAVEQEDIAAKTEGREPDPLIEVAKKAALRWVLKGIKEQADNIATSMRRNEGIYTLNDRGDVPYYVKAQQRGQKEIEEYWKRRLNDRTEAANRSKQASDYEAGIENYDRNKDPLEKMSRLGIMPYWREKENKLFDEAEKTAHLFKQNEYQGTVVEKYQYLLDSTIKNVEKGSLDRVYYPERGREIDKKLYETLFVRGYEEHKILEVIQEKSPFLVGLENDSTGEDNSLRSYKNYISSYTHDGTLNRQKLLLERETLERWRIAQEISDDDRRSPDEIHNAKVIRSKEFLKEFGTYAQNNEIIPSTRQEFQIEAGRRTLKKTPVKLLSREEEEDIALRLLVTRNHDPEAIAEALNKSSLSGVGNPDAGHTIVNHLQQELKTNPYHQKLQRLVDEVKPMQGLEHETRLDRLGLDTPLSGTKEYTVEQRPKDKGLDYEFER